MKKDKLKLYSIEILLLIALFIALIVSNKMTYITSSIILAVFAIVIKLTLKKKESKSLYKKQVAWIMVAFALIYLLAFFLIGMIKNDFLRQPVIFGFKTLYRFIIPLTVSIISSEIMREILISQDGTIRIKNLELDISKALTFINMVCVDLMIYIGLYDLTKYDEFLAAIGFVLFASISCNLLYNYISKRYGNTGIILYRMLTILYVYIIPITPNIHIYLQSFFRMIYPYFLYLFLEKSFSKTDFVVSYSDRRKNFLSITIMIVVMTAVTMLISCEFKYGILVIGSKSMTGSINMGDTVVYERYDDQKISNGQVIIFEQNGLKMVHRVVDIQDINGEIRYYTKGDANEKIDDGYITDKKIIGVTKFRIAAIGYPTLWLRQLFS